LEALEAVEKHAESIGVDSFIHLGDVLGYGANPVECLDWVLKNCEISIQGNHEIVVLRAMKRVKKAPNCNTQVISSAYWTGAQFSALGSDGLLDAVQHMAQETLWKNFYLVHAFPFASSDDDSHASTSKYFLVPGMETAHPWMLSQTVKKNIASRDSVVKAFEKIPTSLCFIGHTHIPCVIEQGYAGGGIPFKYAGEIEGYEMPLHKKVVVNVGSVGQPRDRDPRASYVTFYDGLIEFHRVEYDVEAAQNKIRKGPRDNWHADRLALGR